MKPGCLPFFIIPMVKSPGEPVLAYHPTEDLTNSGRKGEYLKGLIPSTNILDIFNPREPILPKFAFAGSFAVCTLMKVVPAMSSCFRDYAIVVCIDFDLRKPCQEGTVT